MSGLSYNLTVLGLVGRSACLRKETIVGHQEVLVIHRRLSGFVIVSGVGWSFRLVSETEASLDWLMEVQTPEGYHCRRSWITRF